MAGDVTVRFFLVDEFEALAVAANSTKSTRGALGPGAKTIKYGTIAGKEMIFVSFHTAFHADSITFNKNEIDGAYHSSEDKYGEDFTMSLKFRYYEGAESEQEVAAAPPKAWSLKMGSPQLKGLEEFMPKKINSAMQFLDTHAAVRSLFERLCPTPIIFNSGEPIMADVREGYISFHYIVKGNTTTQPPSPIITMQSIKTVFDGEMHGVGDILHRGMDKLVRTGTCQKYWAGASTIQTRLIEIPLTKDGYLPIDAPCCNQADLSQLYSYLAHQVSARSRKYRDKISQLNSSNATKRNARQLESNNDKKVIERLAAHFGISKTECLFCGSSADRRCGDGSFEDGRAYVISNWVLFQGNRYLLSPSKPKELVIRIKDVFASELKGEMVEIHMTSHREASEETDRIQRSSGGHIRRSITTSLAEELSALPIPEKQGWRFAWPERIWQNPFSGVAGWQLWNLFRDHEVPKDKQGQVGLMQKRFVGEHVTIRFPDEESAEEFHTAINARMRELQNHDHRQLSYDMSALKFGYILPEEHDDEEGRDFLQHLLNISEVRTYAPGEEIIHHSDAYRSLYHVISGTALRYSNSNNHMEDIGPGEMVGEWRFLAYNSGFAETSQVVASTEVKCFVSPFEQVQTLCSLRKEYAVRFYRGLALSCIIRARQFRRLYQQNLQSNRDKDDGLRKSRKKHPHTRSHSNGVSLPNGVFGATSNPSSVFGAACSDSAHGRQSHAASAGGGQSPLNSSPKPRFSGAWGTKPSRSRHNSQSNGGDLAERSMSNGPKTQPA